MPTIKKLKLKLKSGLLSELQSDTIYGHFCWRLKEQLGENKLLEFIQHYQQGNPLFTLSDGLLEKDAVVFFPKPLFNTPFKIEAKTKKERIEQFLSHKEKKSTKFITLEQLNIFLSGDTKKFEESFNNPGSKTLIAPKLKQDLRVSVEIDRNTFSAKESQLFSYNPSYLDDDKGKTFFVIFVKVLDQEKFNAFKCEEVLKSVFEIGFGKKKSTGYGQFEVLELSDYKGFSEADESNGFITFGNFLPSSSDKLLDGFYDYHVKYGKLGETFSQSDNPFKRPIILFKSGSCFFTDTKKDFHGRITDNSEITDYKPSVVQFGMPFTLRFKNATYTKV